jgi:hypothetical protein
MVDLQGIEQAGGMCGWYVEVEKLDLSARVAHSRWNGSGSLSSCKPCH